MSRKPATVRSVAIAKIARSGRPTLRLTYCLQICAGGRRKVTYAITSQGRKHLAAWLKKPPEPGPRRDELILKIFFGSQTDPETLIGHLKRHRDQVQAMMDQNRHWLVEARNATEPCSPYPLLTLRGGLAVGEAFVKWADETLAELSRMRKGKSP